MTHANEILLDVKNLKKYFPIKSGFFQKTIGQVKAVNDVSFSVRKGETLGIVGESGCGKSTLGRTIIRLYEPNEGQILFKEKNITSLKEREFKKIIRKDIQMIFQDPFASINPKKSVESILEEPLHVHKIGTRQERKERVAYLLEKVGLSPSFRQRYPHQLSGGQRQRIGIARSLVLHPELIIADEPVSALDVSVQAQIVNLMQDLQEEFQLTYIFISHDLSIIKHISDRVAVMYLGKCVELADKPSLFKEPLHPYTQALLSAVPIPRTREGKKRERVILQGEIPSPAKPPSGCVFHTRCPVAFDLCSLYAPEQREVKKGKFVACHLYH